ncbi:MAG: hypothetical protein AB1634_07300 [Thermodesulfobacteriota bacterium]
MHPVRRGPALWPFLALAVLFALVVWQRDWILTRLSAPAVQQERSRWEGRVDGLERKVAALEAALAGPGGAGAEADRAARLGAVFGAGPEPPAAEPVVEPAQRCRELAGRIRSLFAYLDGLDYIQAAGLAGGSEAFFSALATRALAAPPPAVRETDDLAGLLANATHFFRLLGAKDLTLVRTVLDQERDLVEPALALFWEWVLLGEACQDTQLAIRPTVAQLYEYAGFFLNTLGGNAYLARRKPELRLLARYYAVLILDQANDRTLNRHGIDIRPAIDTLSDEVPASALLAGRLEYGSRLADLQAKYQALYGPRS